MQDAEDVNVLLATHIYTIEKGVKEGFGGVREVLRTAVDEVSEVEGERG